MIYAANWKMNHNAKTAKSFLSDFKGQIKKEDQSSFIFLAPTLLFPVFQKELKGTEIKWGGQNCFSQDEGAFTGENSPSLMHEIGATHCLVGHSERRLLFGEDQPSILKKVEAISKNKMTPILCVGETRKERESNQWKQVIKSQLEGTSSFYSIIAYEPVWAIGTGISAQPEQIQEVIDYIFHIIPNPILYGGSVNESNAKELKSINNLKGFLIGGASLKTKSLLSIYNQTP